MGSKSFNIIHKDDYLLENVKLSSFTVLDDIMILIGRGKRHNLHIFDPYGTPKTVNIDPTFNKVFEEARILNITTSGKVQYFLL